MQHALFIVFIINVMCLSAQPAIQWQRSFGGAFGDFPTNINNTTLGYIVSCFTQSPDGDVTGYHGGGDGWLLQLDENGNINWKKCYGGSSFDIITYIDTSSLGGYWVVGTTLSNNGDVNGNHGGHDCWVMKLDAVGEIVWSKLYGGSADDLAMDAVPSIGGGLVITGHSKSDDGDIMKNQGNNDVWVFKIDTNGNLEWQYSYGGSGRDESYCIVSTRDGGYMVGGMTNSMNGDVGGTHGFEDLWAIKLNENGEMEWNKTYGGNGSDTGTELLQTKDGGYFLTGQSGSSSGQITEAYGHGDIWVLKLNEFGELIWQRILGGSDQEGPNAVFEQSDGKLLVIGATESTDHDVVGNDGGFDLWLVKLNTEDGTLIWQQTYGGTKADSGGDLTLSSDNGLILAGYNWSTDGDATECKGNRDLWLVKLAPESSPTFTPTPTPQPTLFPTPTPQLTLSPNPATDQVFLEAPASPLRVRVCDLLGRVCLNTTLAPGEPLVLPGLAPGIYTVYATDESGQLYSGKLWKE